MGAPRFGIGFRTPYASAFAEAPPGVDWLEVVSDHHIGVGGPRRALLARLRRDRPVALHGVGLGIAGCDPLDDIYLEGLRELIAFCEPVHVSDHLCWTALGGRTSHDLLPVAYTEQVLRHVVERVQRVQDRIGRRLLLENATAYVAFRASELDEAEFTAELCQRSGCGVLLDVNNLYVNAQNLGSDPARWLSAIPQDAVGYLHLAGHAVLPDVRIDTHAQAVPAAVWQLFEQVVRRHPGVDVILERDDALPPLDELVAELAAAREHYAVARERGAAGGPARSPGARRPAARATERAWPELQRAFWQCAVEADASSGEAGDALFATDRPVRAARGARVYADAYRASLDAALATNFPALARVLAPWDWQRLARDYLRAHPPRGHGFVGLGADLADFVRSFAFASDYGVPASALAEVAMLEQAELEAQDAPDPRGVVTPEALAGVAGEDWEELRPVFVPGLRLVRASHDVATVVSAVSRGEVPSRPEPTPCAYLVGRGCGGVVTERLAREGASLLETLLAGRPFGEACAGAYPGTTEEEVAVRSAQQLVHWTAQGLVSAV